MNPDHFKNRITADFLLQAVLRIYLVFLCAVFPLYTGRGKYDLMIYYKKDLFVRGTAAAAAAACILLIVKLFRERRERKFADLFSRFDILMAASFLAAGISFVWAEDHYQAWNGAPGWFMGLKICLILLFIYAAYAKLFRWDRRDALCVFVGPFLVFLLADLSRLGLWTLDPEHADPMYLSTIGNVNWLSGFSAVLFSAGAGIYASGVCGGKRENLLWSLFLAAGWFSLLANGSDAVFLWIAALSAVLICYGISSKEAAERVLHCFVLLVLVGCFMVILQKLRPDIRAMYLFPNATGIAARTTRSPLWFAAAALLISLGFLLKKNHYAGHDAYRPLKILVIAGAVLTGLFLLCQLTGVITIPDSFGTGRGYIWRLCRGLYKDLPLMRKLIGIGPDCFGYHTLADWDFMMALMEMFPGSHTVNAHSEPLTMLFNVGVLGTGTYFAAVIYGMIRLLKQKTPCCVPVLAAVTACTANQLVSFQTIVSTPYLYLALGLAGYLIANGKPEPEPAPETPKRKGPKKKKKGNKKNRRK